MATGSIINKEQGSIPCMDQSYLIFPIYRPGGRGYGMKERILNAGQDYVEGEIAIEETLPILAVT